MQHQGERKDACTLTNPSSACQTCCVHFVPAYLTNKDYETGLWNSISRDSWQYQKMDRRRANSGHYHKDAGQRIVEEHGLQRLSARDLMMMMNRFTKMTLLLNFHITFVRFGLNAAVTSRVFLPGRGWKTSGRGYKNFAFDREGAKNKAHFRDDVWK